MSIPVCDLEPGGVYRRHTGQVREILSIDGKRLIYRMIKRSHHVNAMTIFPGHTKEMSLHHFAYWADEEIA